jgi:glucosamine-6-phosphate deaminase
MGIGENTHIAFNDPHVADFNDLLVVKIVSLDANCRQQQVNDKCFADLKDVPTHAITLTIPALMAAQYVCCVVPGKNKAAAVQHTLNDEVTEKYPSTILRNHPWAMLYLDRESSAI